MGRTFKNYKKLDKVLKPFSVDEKYQLNDFLMSGNGPLQSGVNLDVISHYLLQLEPAEVEALVVKAKKFALETENAKLDGVSPAAAKILNFNLQVAENMDPKTLFIVSRDVSDSSSDKLILQEISIDEGNFLPLSTVQLATTLRDYADVLMIRQEELNANDHS